MIWAVGSSTETRTQIPLAYYSDDLVSAEHSSLGSGRFACRVKQQPSAYSRQIINMPQHRPSVCTSDPEECTVKSQQLHCQVLPSTLSPAQMGFVLFALGN